jgi:hypothetical protein
MNAADRSALSTAASIVGPHDPKLSRPTLSVKPLSILSYSREGFAKILFLLCGLTLPE